jgi:hypothetical protein
MVRVPLDGSASGDADGTVSAYSWSGTPKPDNVVSPAVTLSEGSHVFSLIVTDDKGATSPPSSVTITVAKEVVHPPLFTAPEASTFSVATGAATPLTIPVSASSPDNRPVAITAAPLITNATFSATPGIVSNGSFGLQPFYGQQGSYLVTFTARDSYGLTATKTVRIDVGKTNREPTLTVPENATVDEGKALVIPVSASDPDGDAITMTSSALPANAVFIPATGSLSFMPDFTQSGSYPVTITASDGSLTTQRSVTITVNDVSTGSGSEQLKLTVDPFESPTFLATQRITGRVNSAGPAQPALKSALITRLEPTGGEQGVTLSVLLTGAVGAYATHFATGNSTLSFGDGVSVKKFTVTGPATATAEISIDPTATTGIRQVMVTTGNETAFSINAFSVRKGVTTISGRLLDEGGAPLANATIVIQGTNQTATSDANGNFTLTGTSAGEQKLLVTTANHEVITVNVNPQIGTVVDLGTLTSASTVFDPAAPPTVSLLSVVGRGACAAWPNGGKSTLKKALVDTLFLVGGSDAGVLDEYGNQTNPEVTGQGVTSLTPKGLDVLADKMLAGEQHSLPHLLFSASHGFGWGGTGQPITLEQWLGDLQAMVNQAWQDPTNPDNYLPLIIFNTGNTLSPDPPILSYLTKLNPFQTFLLTNSLLAYMIDRN